MKTTLFSILISYSIYTSAQVSPKYHYNLKGFNTCFQNTKKGYFNGDASGMMQFEFKDSIKFLTSFSKDSAHLNILPDPYEIYDISTKVYSVILNNNILVEYRTYSKANAFLISVKGYVYKLDLIDGACFAVIDGLDYEYVQDEDRELLIIHFTDKVGLYEQKNYAGAQFYIPNLFVLKGSTLIFNIKK